MKIKRLFSSESQKTIEKTKDYTSIQKRIIVNIRYLVVQKKKSKSILPKKSKSKSILPIKYLTCLFENN